MPVPDAGWALLSLLRRRPKSLLFLVAAVAVAVAVIAVVRSGGSPAGSPMTSPRAAGSRSSAPGPSSTASPGAVSAPAAPVAILGHPLPGVHARWELFG